MAATALPRDPRPATAGGPRRDPSARSSIDASPGLSPLDLAQAALSALRSGQVGQAQDLAHALLLMAPEQAGSHIVWARVLRAQGHAAQACEAAQQALQRAPDDVGAWMERAQALRAAGRLDEARSTYRDALQRTATQAQPAQRAALHHNLANLLQQAQEWPEAEAHYREALTLIPAFVEAHAELGNLLQATDRWPQACVSWAEALWLRPDFAPAWHRLIDALQAQDPVHALHALLRHAPDGDRSPRVLLAVARAAQALSPEAPIGQYAAGLALRLQGQLHDAMPPLQTLVAATVPGHVLHRQGLYLLTLCRMELGQVGAAQADAERLLGLAEHDDERAKAHQLLAGLMLEASQTADACRHFEQAMALAPTFAPPRLSCAAAQLYLPQADVRAMRARTRALVAPLLDALPAPLNTALTAPPLPLDRPLRVGLLSGDFRVHSCAYFLAPLLTHHDRSRVLLHAYATERAEDAMTQRLQAQVPHWRRVADDSDDALAERIAADGIDVLIDLAGLSDGNRLRVLARRVAPVQLSWLGWVDSTGVDAVDARLSDALVEPVVDASAPEPVRHLGAPYVCYEAPNDAPDPMAPPMLRRGHPTFGSFNALSKLSDPCLALWARVLHARPDAHLLIKAKALADDGVRQATLARLAKLGIAPERVRLQGWQPSTAHHLALYHEVDVALDSWPYQGVTTTCEASWMGVPVVSRVGTPDEGPVSRQGLTLLTALGRPDLACHDDDAFVARCLALVADPDALGRERAAQRARMRASALMDGPGFARRFETACLDAWQDARQAQRAR